MKRCALTVLTLAGAHPLCAEPTPSPAPSQSEQAPAVDSATIKQVLEAERSLAKAIDTQDVAALESLLSKDYVSAEERAEWAISRTGTLTRFKLGKLISYVIERDPRCRRERNAIVVEGLAEPRTNRERDESQPKVWVSVTHYWVKQSDRWVLAGQLLPEHEMERRREAGEAH